MWFRNVFLKSLRDYRAPILGWGIGMGVVIVAPMATVSSLMATPAARAELVTLAQTFAWNAAAVAVDTVGGYATFKIGVFIFLITVWPLLAGGRLLRAEEERGSLDVLLSLPRGRVRVAIEKLLAMWTALLVMGALIGVIVYLGGQAFAATFTFGDALLLGLDLALLCAVFGAIALLVSQFTQEPGSAAGITGALLVVFIVLDMVHRLYPGTEWISQLSPIYYYNLSKPLVSIIDAGGMLVLGALALVLSAAALWTFARRDIGATVRMPRVLPSRPEAPRGAALPARDWSLRSVYARGLAMLAIPTFWWTVVIAGFGWWMVIVIKQVEGQLTTLFSTDSGNATAMIAIIENVGGGKIGANATFLSAMFQLLPIMLMAFAVTQVNRWAADEEDGRLELVLATPQPRIRVILGRYAALATAIAFIGVLTLAATTLAAQIAGLELDTGNLAAAALGMIPLALLIAAIGYLAAGWLRTAVDTGLVTLLLVLWFFISFIGPDLSLPDATLRLSPFYYYGTPLLHGLVAANVIGLLGVGLVALVIGALRFARKDIGV